MAVKMRLRREGKKKQPFYRVVVADVRSPRDGRYIEDIGYYQPTHDPSTIQIDEERALHWLRHGVQPSDAVKQLLRIQGIWEQFKPGDPGRDRSDRNARKAAAAEAKAAEAKAAEAKVAEAKAAEAAEAAAAEAAAAEAAAAEASAEAAEDVAQPDAGPAEEPKAEPEAAEEPKAEPEAAEEPKAEPEAAEEPKEPEAEAEEPKAEADAEAAGAADEENAG